MKVFIVEDELEVISAIEKDLAGREGYTVSVATHGKDALTRIRNLQPDLLFVDINLAGEIDGDITIELLQNQTGAPIILIANESSQITSERIRVSHSIAYLLKPIQPHELEIALEIATAQHAVEKKLIDNEAQLRALYQLENESRKMAEILAETSQVLASSLDEKSVLDSILTQVSRIVENDVCNIILIEGGNTRIVRSRGYESFDAETFIETFVFPLSGLPVRQHIIQTQQPVVVSDVRTDPEWKLPANAAWLRSYVAAPIILNENVIGFINVGNSRAGFYKLADATRLQAFGNQAALAFQNARLHEQTLVNAAHTKILSRRLLNVQESERRAIARGLHDEIGQALTAAKLNLQSLQVSPEAAPIQARIEDCANIIDQTLQQVRSISRELHPAILDDLGLLPAVRWFVDREALRGNYTAHVDARNLPDSYPAEIELVCFRVIQEALTNISRHASAKNVTVEFCQENANLYLYIRDDGIGFDKELTYAKVMKSDSLGLLSMQERIMLINGQFEINSAPGRGTEIHACIPLNRDDTP